MIDVARVSFAMLAFFSSSFFFFKCCVNIFHPLDDDNDSFLKNFEGESVTLRVLVMESLSHNPLNNCIINYLLLLVWWSLFWVHWIFVTSNVVVKSSIGFASIGPIPIFPHANDNSLIFVNFCRSFLPFHVYSFPILYTYMWNFFKYSWYILLSHEWWIPLIKFIVKPIIHTRWVNITSLYFRSTK